MAGKTYMKIYYYYYINFILWGLKSMEYYTKVIHKCYINFTVKENIN